MLYFSLFIAVLLLPIRIRFVANTENDALKLQAEVVLFGKKFFRFYESNITVKSVVQSIFSGKKRGVGGARIFNIVKDYSRINKISIHARIGTGDASTCALLCGQGCGLITPFCANLAKGNYDIQIKPVFDEAVFELFGECILSLNIANAIFALLKLKRGNKNGKSSNRKHNVGYHGKS